MPPTQMPSLRLRVEEHDEGTNHMCWMPVLLLEPSSEKEEIMTEYDQAVTRIPNPVQCNQCRSSYWDREPKRAK